MLTHTNSVYAEEITLIDYVKHAQYVHQVSDGGMVVEKGIKPMPGELIDYVLRGAHGAAKGTAEYIRELTSESSRKVGFILSAGGASWAGYGSTLQRSDKYPALKLHILGATQVCAGQLANKLGTFDYISTDSVSCISGHSAWYSAYNLIRLGELDAVVVVAADNGVAEEYLAVFGEFGLSKQQAEEDTDVVKFRLGQGANISVFESSSCIESTGHKALAEIQGMRITAEAHVNPLGISEKGDGYTKVMSQFSHIGFDFIKTHSTFSEDNQIEEDIIRSIFGDIRTVNYKLRIGHTMGASTAIESALAIQEESGTFLSLGAGMGNVFSGAVIKII